MTVLVELVLSTATSVEELTGDGMITVVVYEDESVSTIPLLVLLVLEAIAELVVFVAVDVCSKILEALKLVDRTDCDTGEPFTTEDTFCDEVAIMIELADDGFILAVGGATVVMIGPEASVLVLVTLVSCCSDTYTNTV